MTLPVHPALAAFPMLHESEIGELGIDIRKNGLLSAVVRQDGLILDGRARLTACERLGIEPAFVEYSGEPVDFVLRTNGGRRLSSSQRALVAAELLVARRVSQETQAVSRETAQAGEYQVRLLGVSRETPDAVTAFAIGETMGVSRATLFRAAKLLSKGTPDVIDAVRRGEIPVASALKGLASTSESKPPKPKSDRQTTVAAVDRVEKRAHALVEELRELAADALGRKLLEDLLLDLAKQLFELTEAPARDAEPGAS